MPNVQVAVHYMSMFFPTSQSGTTDDEGKVVLPIGDDNGYGFLLNAELGNLSIRVAPQDLAHVHNGGIFFGKAYAYSEDRWGQVQSEPRIAFQLAPHKASLLQRLTASNAKPAYPNPAYGMCYTLPEYNVILEVTVKDKTTGSVLWHLNRGKEFGWSGPSRFECLHYGKTPANMSETTPARPLKEGDRIVLEINYQFDLGSVGPIPGSLNWEYVVEGPNRFRMIPK